MKQLSLIIVTYNSENLILDCLDSIFKYNDLGNELEIIVVDNCSDDQGRVFSAIRGRYGLDIKLVKNIANNGYGAGNNLGVQYSTAEFFVVMNPDVRLVEPVFKKILNRINHNESIGLLGVKFVDGSNCLYFKPEYTNLFNLIFNRSLIKLGFYDINKMFLSGSFLSFRKKAFEVAGCFDENIFLYHEEADISNRILKHGFQTVLANDIYVLHLAHKREVNPYLLKVGSESRKYYFEKYGANISKYYANNVHIYRVKYLIATVLNNKIKKTEFKTWLTMCKNNGLI